MMLIDRYLPGFEFTEVQEIEVDAPPAVTYAAIRETDLRDPVIDALFAVRELPNRIVRRMRGEAPPRAPASLTFGDVATRDMGWLLLGEEPGSEFVVGSIGQFWRRDYGWHPVAAEEFAGFAEPGYAKLAVSFRVRSTEAGGTVLRYEARTATTDDVARTRFRRYWRLIHPGIAIVMHRALTRIRDEAERRFAAARAGVS
ncbi:MAG TPA: hypothetical protein VFY16_02410 [Gemmatimonadaceae bacterium]|nr:hypothetical protein [Gemmatimonadaceae bacterium]